jgi:hypothetical protein
MADSMTFQNIDFSSWDMLYNAVYCSRSQSRQQADLFLLQASSLHGLFLKNWGDMFLRNTGWLSPNYKALYEYLSRWNSSQPPLWISPAALAVYKPSQIRTRETQKIGLKDK